MSDMLFSVSFNCDSNPSVVILLLCFDGRYIVYAAGVKDIHTIFHKYLRKLSGTILLNN